METIVIKEKNRMPKLSVNFKPTEETSWGLRLKARNAAVTRSPYLAESDACLHPVKPRQLPNLSSSWMGIVGIGQSRCG